MLAFAGENPLNMKKKHKARTQARPIMQQRRPSVALRPASKSVIGKTAMERRMAGGLPAAAAVAAPTASPTTPSRVRASSGVATKQQQQQQTPSVNSSSVDAAAAAIKAAIAQRNDEEQREGSAAAAVADAVEEAGEASSSPTGGTSEQRQQDENQQQQQQQTVPSAADKKNPQPLAKVTPQALVADSPTTPSKRRDDTISASSAGSGIAPAKNPNNNQQSSQQQQQQQKIVLRRRFRGASQITRHNAANSTEMRSPIIASQRTVDTAFSLISRSPLFTSLRDQRVIMKIAETVTWASAEPGQYVVVAGEAATEMYFLFSGVVEVLVPVSEEEEMFVATLNGGDFFGEIALVSMDQTKRTASIQAVRPCELLVLSRQALEGYIADSDELRECLELEAAKRLQGLKERETKLLANESDLDRELLHKAGLNPLSPIECEWRLLNKARIRGVHRTQGPPSTFADAMAWARLHMQHTPTLFHGRTTSALATLPTDILVSAAAASSSSSATDGGLLLIHPEMGSVFKYSVVIDSLAGPDEFDHLCRSLARCLGNNLKLGLQKQSLGALALGAHVALFFSHTRRAERDRFLTLFANRLVATILAAEEQEREESNKNNGSRRHNSPNRASTRGRSGTRTNSNSPRNNNYNRGENVQFGLQMSVSDSPSSSSLNKPSSSTTTTTLVAPPPSSAALFVWDAILLDSMTAQLYRAPSWEVSTTILFDLYPKQFVLSDAWAIATLERLIAMREEMIKRVCATAIEQMIERAQIAKRFAADRTQMEKGFVQRRLVIKRARRMLLQIEGQHRARLDKQREQVAAGIFRWHETCMSVVSTQRNAQDSALAGMLGSDMDGAHYGDGGASSSSGGATKNRLSFFRGSSSARRAHSASAGTSSSAPRRQAGAGGGDIARLVAQKERMADDAVLFRQRVKELRHNNGM